MNGEPTNHEILEAIQTFSSSVDQRFDRVDQRLDRVEATMVTKDYLDEKLADLRGDLVVLTRKEDEDDDALVRRGCADRVRRLDGVD